MQTRLPPTVGRKCFSDCISTTSSIVQPASSSDLSAVPEASPERFRFPDILFENPDKARLSLAIQTGPPLKLECGELSRIGTRFAALSCVNPTHVLGCERSFLAEVSKCREY